MGAWLGGLPSNKTFQPERGQTALRLNDVVGQQEINSMSDQVTCSQCGRMHSRDEMELSFKGPDIVAALPDAQRKSEVRETNDLCAIRNDHFYVRGVIPLPVAGWGKPYRIGAWVEVERAAFDRIRELWDAADQETEPPFVAQLANNIPSLPSTLDLSVQLQLIGPTIRPDILVPESKHPLHREQCQGITAHRAHEYSSLF